jgi:hypothetical protein
VGGIVPVTVTPRESERAELSVDTRVAAAAAMLLAVAALPSSASGMVRSASTLTLAAATRSSRKHAGWWQPRVVERDDANLSFAALSKASTPSAMVKPTVTTLATTVTTLSP